MVLNTNRKEVFICNMNTNYHLKQKSTKSINFFCYYFTNGEFCYIIKQKNYLYINVGGAMPRFFVESENFDGTSIVINGDDAWHIARSLRMAVGEEIIVCTPDAKEHVCVLERITDESVKALVKESRRAKGEFPFKTVLYQALPKGDKMDTIVQKAVENGVSLIVPFLSERCVSRPDEKSLEKKRARWQRIALEAAKQCGRGVVPAVLGALSFSQMLEEAKTHKLCCFCYEGEDKKTLKNVLQSVSLAQGDTVSVVVGSEGGFSEKEALSAHDAGASTCGLGERILRCESASSYALACISYEFEL